MIEIDCVQGTDEWFKARAGVMTASEFDRLLTATGKPSSQLEDYAFQLATERLLGRPTLNKAYGWMDHGRLYEREALEAFGWENGLNVRKVGFILMDGEGFVGCSPDGWLVDDDTGLEIKCPATHTHARYLKNKVLPREYVHQVQGSMYATNRGRWHFLSYHVPVDDMGNVLPGKRLAPLHVVVQRDEAYIEKLHAQVEIAKSVIIDAVAALADSVEDW